MSIERPVNEDLIKARAALRQTWPSLTDMDLEDFPPRSRSEAADVIRRRTARKDSHNPFRVVWPRPGAPRTRLKRTD